MTASKKTTYSSIRSNFQNKMNGYKMLWSQTTGAAAKNRPTPAQLNTFSKWIEKGATIQCISSTQLNRWAGKQCNWTVTSAKTQMANRFGKNFVKAVAWNKSGGFIVATTFNKSGKNYNVR